MEVMPSIYQSAPTSPGGNSPDGMQFYSALSSPAKEISVDTSDDLNSSFDNFEFETSKKFGDYMEFEISDNYESLLGEQEKHPEKPKRARGGSLPTMAFADELFYNGQVMPLKPPPPLNCSIPSSPKSPRSPNSVLKVPFMRRPVAAWNDDFDPFKVALEKVSDENRGRTSNAGSNHRRSRSHSPFRTDNSEWCHDQNKEGRNLEAIQNLGPNSMKQRERSKGSHYARWVHDQTKLQVDDQGSPKGKNYMFKALSFGGRIRPVKTDHDGSSKSTTSSQNIEDDEKDGVGAIKIRGIKGILLKYASFRRENSDYFKKLSFKIKGVASGNGKRRAIEESKLTVVEYKRKKPTFALCFYGIESPRNIV